MKFRERDTHTFDGLFFPREVREKARGEEDHHHRRDVEGVLRNAGRRHHDRDCNHDALVRERFYEIGR